MTVQRHHWISLLLALITVVAYSEVRDLEFTLWDDDVNVFDNPYLQRRPLASVGHFWREPYGGFYIPVTRTVWAAIARFAAVAPRQAEAGGPSLGPQPFHLANLVLHVVNVLLVYAILRLLVASDWPAAAGAALFALHPVQVEPVAWVTGLKDVLGGMLALLALWQYLLYAAATRDPAKAKWRRVHYAAAILAFALATLAKQTVVVVPLMAWALDRWVLGRPARECTWALAGWVPVAVGAAVIAAVADTPDFQVPPVWARFFVAGDALAFYLSKLAFPLRLCCHYGRQPDLVLTNWWGYVTWLIPAALAVGLWLRRRRALVMAAAFAVFVAGLLPVLGLVPFANQDVCDRFMYLAMLGPGLALAWALARHGGKLLAAACVLALALFVFQTACQTLHWHNTFALFQHALVVNPNSWAAHINLGAARDQQGKTELAIAHYREALRLDPESLTAHADLGCILYREGRADEAAAHFGEAVRLHPELPQVHDYLAAALDAQGLTQEAHAHWEEALRLNPDYAPAHNNLAASLYALGDTDQAIAHWREALRIVPDFAHAQRGLAEALRAQSQQQPPE